MTGNLPPSRPPVRPVGGVGSRAAGRPLHPCPRCGKTFTKRSNMIIHERLHTGEMPYTCKFPGCGKKYKWLSSINFHENRCTLKTTSIPTPKEDDDDDDESNNNNTNAASGANKIANDIEAQNSVPSSAAEPSGAGQSANTSKSNASQSSASKSSNTTRAAATSQQPAKKAAQQKTMLSMDFTGSVVPNSELPCFTRPSAILLPRRTPVRTSNQIQVARQAKTIGKIGKRKPSHSAQPETVTDFVSAPMQDFSVKQERDPALNRLQRAIFSDNPGSPDSLLSTGAFELGSMFAPGPMLPMPNSSLCMQAPPGLQLMTEPTFEIPISPMTPQCGGSFAQSKSDNLLDDFCLTGVDLFPGGSLINQQEGIVAATQDGALMGEVFGVVPSSVFAMETDLSNDALLF